MLNSICSTKIPGFEQFKRLLPLFFIIIAANLFGQTTIIDATGDGGFETGATFAANNWTVTNGAATQNQWVCDTGATAGFTGARCAYVTNNSAGTPPPHTYTDTPTRVSHFYSDITVPAGEDLVILNFDWIGQAESIFDYMRIWVVPTTYTPVYGTQITAAGTVPTGRIQIGGNFSGQGTWTNETYNFPNGYAGTTVRLVFEWRNDASIGNNPPAAIDNISLISDVFVPATNDECISATTLLANSDQSCTNFEDSTILNATDSGEDNCFGTPDDDVWFEFVATSTSHTVDLYNIFGSVTDLYHAVYEATAAPDCNNLNVLTCSDADSSITAGLTIGNTYYIQVFTYTATGGQNTDFRICVGTPILPPNDECANAINLIPQVVCNYTTYTTEFATNSAGAPAPSCANYQGGDVWFTVTIPASGEVTIDTDDIDFTDSGMAVYSGTCGSLTQVQCDDDGGAGLMSSITLTGQTPGTVFYIRLWEFGNNDSGNFGICVTTPIPPGTNGAYVACPGEPSVPVSSDMACPPSGAADFGSGPTTTYSGTLASSDPVAVQPEIFITDAYGCDFDDDGDTANYVATTFTVSANGTYTFESNATFDAMGYIVIDDGTWTAGTCPGTWTWITGDDDSGPGLEALLTANLLTGTTYTFITTAFSSSDIVVNGSFTWTISTIAPEVQWYDQQTGGTMLGIGAFFDPVASGALANTNTPGVYTYWAGCAGSGLPRERADFVIGKLWDGSTDANWNVPANWTPSGIPTPDDCVFLRPDSAANPFDIITNGNPDLGPPFPPSPGFGKTLTVMAGVNFELGTGTSLTITDEITVDGTFDIRDDASLVQVTDVVANLNSGDIRMQRTAENVNSNDYIYWSSPVENFDVADVSPGTTSTYIWRWIPTVGGNGIGNHGDWTNATGNMQIGKGYIIKDIVGTTPALTPTFIGRANNGIINMPITRGTHTSGNYTGNNGVVNGTTPSEDNWNLVGNPYPSAIAYTDFITPNTVIDGTIYLWTHQTQPSNAYSDPFYDNFGANYNPNDYIEYNSSGANPNGSFNGNIAAGQAFFVLMLDNATTNENVVFNNTMRNGALDNSQFFLPDDADEEEQRVVGTEKHRIWLNIIDSNNFANSTLVGYIEGATEGVDRLFDGYEFSANILSIYSMIDDKKFSIQGKSLPFNIDDEVPLGFEVPANDIYTIGINTVDGLFENEDQDIYLEDTYSNTIHDLRASPYSFTSEAGTFNDRFILRYTFETLNIEDTDDSNLSILGFNNTIKIKASSPIDSVVVFDLLGRQIFQLNNINETEVLINDGSLSSGVYMVKASLTNQRAGIKKVVLN